MIASLTEVAGEGGTDSPTENFLSSQQFNLNTKAPKKPLCLLKRRRSICADTLNDSGNFKRVKSE